jgi:hypothetical protein
MGKPSQGLCESTHLWSLNEGKGCFGMGSFLCGLELVLGQLTLSVKYKKELSEVNAPHMAGS